MKSDKLVSYYIYAYYLVMSLSATDTIYSLKSNAYIYIYIYNKDNKKLFKPLIWYLNLSFDMH